MRGGKREGAGRPKGTKKAVTKKMFSFRLSEEEEKAVKNLLKQMRGKIFIFYVLFMFLLCS